MPTSLEEKRCILVAQDGVKGRFKILDREIRTHKHEESRKFSRIAEDCGYIEARRNSSNMCHAVKTPSLHVCWMDICPFIKEKRGKEEG